MVYNLIVDERSFLGDAMSLSDKKVIELYSNGKTCAEISHSGQCSETSIYNRLIYLGVKVRNRSEANKIFPDYIFIRLYNIGLSSSQIGRVLGLNSSTTTKRLHTIGFPLRSRGVASKIRYTEEEFVKYFMAKNFLDKLVELTN